MFKAELFKSDFKRGFVINGSIFEMNSDIVGFGDKRIPVVGFTNSETPPTLVAITGTP